MIVTYRVTDGYHQVSNGMTRIGTIWSSTVWVENKYRVLWSVKASVPPYSDGLSAIQYNTFEAAVDHFLLPTACHLQIDHLAEGAKPCQP